MSPGGLSENRLIIYGNALEWEFFGQTLNWLELGWKRYFYSLAKVLWAWIPHCIGFVVFFITILILSIKKLKRFYFELVTSVFFIFIRSNDCYCNDVYSKIYLWTYGFGRRFCCDILYLNIIFLFQN